MKWFVILSLLISLVYFFKLSLIWKQPKAEKQVYFTAIIASVHLFIAAFFGFISYKQYEMDNNIKAIERYFSNSSFLAMKPSKSPIMIQVEQGYFTVEVKNGNVISVSKSTKEKWEND